ncbi:MAG: glycosyltransferase family 4 protein [Candidatus Thorarchaeota archaeon]
MKSPSSPKRIAVFVEHFPPYLGSDRSIFELSKRAAAKGVNIHFVVTQPLRYLYGQRPATWKYKENWKSPPPKVHSNISAKYLLLGKWMEALWLHFPPLAYLITLVLFTASSLKETIRFGPDVVVCAHASPILGVVAYLSAKLSLRPILMAVPDWMSAYAAGLMQESMASLGPALLQMVELRLYKLSNRIFTATEFLKKLLTDYGVRPEIITVISNGVDPDQFSPSVDYSDIIQKYRLKGRRVVLFSGHLEEWAGLSLIYDLAKRLDSDAPQSHILLVGSGRTVGLLLQKLATSGLGHMLTHAGFHPFKEMPKFIAASDVALCIFPDTPMSHAASPLKLFEYMGSGRAIVATSVAGTAEILDDTTGVLVSPGDSDEICDAVVKLCQHPDLRKELGGEARRVVTQKYTWEFLAERFLDECRATLRS